MAASLKQDKEAETLGTKLSRYMPIIGDGGVPIWVYGGYSRPILATFWPLISYPSGTRSPPRWAGMAPLEEWTSAPVRNAHLVRRDRQQLPAAGFYSSCAR